MEKLVILLFLTLLALNIGEESGVNHPIFHEGEVTDSIFIRLKTADDQLHWFLDLELGEKYCWAHQRYEILSKVKKKLDKGQ
tara:strand:+ start:252 stop:497 length:246 start_codon:yes stop_codon:yes gene_type:complete